MGIDSFKEYNQRAYAMRSNYVRGLSLNLFKTFLIGILCLGVMAVSLPIVNADESSSNDDVSIDQIKKKLSGAFESISTYTANQRDAAIKNTKEALSEIDKDIDKLEDRAEKGWDATKDVSKEKSDEALKEVQEQRDTLADQYETMKESSGSAWDDIKGGVAKAWSDLKSTWSKSD
jgi:septal ring factor EnvC (AmiA/AmiB activator)